jgi:hypothetical protein
MQSKGRRYFLLTSGGSGAQQKRLEIRNSHLELIGLCGREDYPAIARLMGVPLLPESIATRLRGLRDHQITDIAL